MRALVTGACGFVGGYLTDHLLSCGDEVFGTVLREDPRFKFPSKYVDIQDMEAVHAVITSFRPEVVYHLAGMAFVPEAENNFDIAVRINVLGTHNVYQACHLVGGIKVVFISSAEIYGRVSEEDLPITEKHKINPANNYSLSKAMAELSAERYSQFGRVQSVIIRPFNHLGAGQNDRFVAASFARQLARIANKKQPPVIAVGNLEAKRDFSDVRDIVKGYRLAAEKGKGFYNLGSGKSVSVQQVLDTLITISGCNVTIAQDATRMRPSEVKEVYGSIEKAGKELGWKPTYNLEDTLRSVYDYWFQLEKS